MTADDLVLHDVELDGRRVDVGVRDGRIRSIDERLDPGTVTVDGHGGALVPGLWDHHIHLLATAAAMMSVDVGPAVTDGPAALASTLRSAHARRPPGEWIRAVGYHESVAGELDRAALDELVRDRPVRVQHRSGALWILNSRACEIVGLDDPTGRVLGEDGWLRSRLPASPPDLSAVGRALAGRGVVGVTDMTPDADPSSWDLLAAACSEGALPQHVVVTGGPELIDASPPAPLMRGPVKLYLADHHLPGLDGLVDQVRAAHRAGRAVAFHSVTRASLVLALAALDVAGTSGGDRVEHGAVVPPELADRLAGLGVAVVTQPGFVAERGDRYLVEVDPIDRPHLYPCAGLLERGVAVGGSTDAPFGSLDPWRAIAAATTRRTAAGATVGAGEAVSVLRALQLFTSAPDEPGRPPRPLSVGAPADLCVLAVPLGTALADPAATEVRATVIAGTIAFDGG